MTILKNIETIEDYIKYSECKCSAIDDSKLCFSCNISNEYSLVVNNIKSIKDVIVEEKEKKVD